MSHFQPPERITDHLRRQVVQQKGVIFLHLLLLFHMDVDRVEESRNRAYLFLDSAVLPDTCCLSDYSAAVVR